MFGIFILDQEEAGDHILFSEILQFFTFILGSNFLLPQRANNGKRGILPTSKLNETESFQCLGNSNWTICTPLSPSCFKNFPSFPLSYWEANSYYPRGLIMGKGNHPTPELNERGNFECLGHSNWTICSPLSHFCSDIFPTFTLSYWGANSYYPRGPIMGKGNFSNSKTE